MFFLFFLCESCHVFRPTLQSANPDLSSTCLAWALELTDSGFSRWSRDLREQWILGDGKDSSRGRFLFHSFVRPSVLSIASRFPWFLEVSSKERFLERMEMEGTTIILGLQCVGSLGVRFDEHHLS